MAGRQQGDNFFIKDYEPLRQTLMAIFLYGCYDRGQLHERMEARGYRYSSRRYDSLLQIVRYFWRDAMQANRTASGRKIHYFPTGRYQAKENGLWRMYNMKSVGARDANLFFFLPCAVRCAARRSGNSNASCTSKQVGFQISNDTDIDGFFEQDMMIWRAAANLKAWGFLGSDSAKRIRAVGNILDDIGEDTLRLLYELLFFYRDILPLSSLGYFLQQMIRDYLVYEQGVTAMPKEGVFVHKDVCFQNILNDEVLFRVQTAVEEKRRIRFQCDTTVPNQRRSVWNFLPMKIISDLQYGRQYLIGALTDGYRVYRLDKMSELYFEDVSEKENALPCPNIGKVWTTSCTFQEEHTVVVDFDFSSAAKENATDIEWLAGRLKAQKRTGSIIEESPTQFTYSVTVHDPIEMLPWLRSWAPYARVRYDMNPALAAMMKKGWQELLLRYRPNRKAKDTVTTAEMMLSAESMDIAEQKKPSRKEKEITPSLFLEYRNLYYCAIRAAMHLMSPKQGERHPVKWKARDLVDFITSYANIDNTADKYLNTIAKFGGEPDQLSLFKTEPDGSLRLAYPGTPPPIMLGFQEKRYLRTLLDESGVQTLLGKKEVQRIKERLGDVAPFAWREIIEERGANEHVAIVEPDPTWENVRLLMAAIREGESLSYINQAHDGEHRGVMKPYRIMYSPQERKFQVITAATDAKGTQPRLVLMNIRQLSGLAPIKNDGLDIDVNALIEERKQPILHLVVRPRVGINDIERAFLLFSNYERTAWYDERKDEYHIELSYYSFQFRNEILPRILSLGAAAVVLAPKDVRAQIITIAKQAIKNDSHLF